jgi:hypothetical protein
MFPNLVLGNNLNSKPTQIVSLNITKILEIDDGSVFQVEASVYVKPTEPTHVLISVWYTMQHLFTHLI